MCWFYMGIAQIALDTFQKWASLTGSRSFSNKNAIMVLQKKAQPQFSKYRFHKQSALSQHLWEYADWLGNQYFENRGRVFFLTPIIFANRSHLVALKQVCATKTQSSLPSSHFSPERRLVRYVKVSFYLLWPILISLVSKKRAIVKAKNSHILPTGQW